MNAKSKRPGGKAETGFNQRNKVRKADSEGKA